MSAQLKILLFAISILFTPILLLATGLSFDFDEGYLALLFFYYSPIPASLIGILISIVVLSFDKNQNTLVFFRNVCLPQKAFSIRSQVGTAGAFVLILLL